MKTATHVHCFQKARLPELVLQEGAGAVTALRVSEHAWVARSTIYEQWPNPDTLLLDAIDMVIAPHSPTTTSGDLGADLKTALTSLRERLERQPFRIWFATLLDHANRDPAFGSWFGVHDVSRDVICSKAGLASGTGAKTQQ